jgi:hypothetical protein
MIAKMARPKRFELLTPRFVVWCSIQLSYGRVFRWHFRAQGPPMPHAIGTHFERSRKRAIATGSGPAWQGPEMRAWGVSQSRLAVIPGRCEASNPESRAITSGFRVRSLGERPQMCRCTSGMTTDGRRTGLGSYARARSLRMLSNSTGRSGITIRKVAPMVPSTRWISPPWARTSSAAIASPSPLPPGRPEV